MLRSWPKQVNMHILRSSLTNQVIWHHLHVSISILLWVIGGNGLWPQLTSSDLLVTPQHHLHLDHHRWGEWPWSWKNWVVLVGLCKMGSISTFPHRLIMGTSWNWPALSHQDKKIWEINFIGTDDLKQSCKLHTDPTWTVAMAWPGYDFFFKEGQLTWHGAKNFTECLQ